MKKNISKIQEFDKLLNSIATVLTGIANAPFSLDRKKELVYSLIWIDLWPKISD
jgi:hypothetical protein